MERSRSWEAKNSLASQEILRKLWNQKGHYRVRKSLPPTPILSQINPVRKPQPFPWKSILILSYHLRPGLPSGLFSYSLPTKTCMHLPPPPIRATCPTHLILLHLITRIIFGQECRSWSSSLRNFLQSSVTSSFLDPNTYLSTLSLNKLRLCSSLSVGENCSCAF
jgi:hypothetical protein